MVRGVARVRIGTGATGPGAALWVQATVQDEAPTDARTPDLAREYKAIAVNILQQRGAWQFVDSVQSVSDPAALADLAGYAPTSPPNKSSGCSRPSTSPTVWNA